MTLPSTVDGGPQPAAWQALHIYYTSDSSPLLTECIGPLVRDLRARGLLHRYFFLNYWLEGPHVRLRLQPSSDAHNEVRCHADAAVAAFLARRPALYEADSEFLLDMYEDMFRMEYSKEERIARYGTDGPMPLRPNNSCVHVPYEPEYDKYGGQAGVDLAEWHFEHSSDLVLQLMETTNAHLRTVRLGLAAQLMIILSVSFLGDPDRVAQFLERYHDYWRYAFASLDASNSERYEGNYPSEAAGLRVRFTELHAAIAAGRMEQLTTFGRSWAEHCAELRAGVIRLAREGQLLMPSRDGSSSRAAVTDFDTALQTLLSPYLHMTNNRLGVTIADEAYLSYLLARMLRETAPGFEGTAR